MINVSEAIKNIENYKKDLQDGISLQEDMNDKEKAFLDATKKYKAFTEKLYKKYPQFLLQEEVNNE